MSQLVNEFIRDDAFEFLFGPAPSSPASDVDQGPEASEGALEFQQPELINCTYVSSDEIEIAFAQRLDYRVVRQHVRQIPEPHPGETLVIDFDHVAFDDKEETLVVATNAANRGVLVGVHTYYPENPRLRELAALPNVVLATTHEGVLAGLNQVAGFDHHHGSAAPGKTAQQEGEFAHLWEGTAPRNFNFEDA